MESWSNVITFAEGANKLKESSQPKTLIYLGNIGGPRRFLYPPETSCSTRRGSPAAAFVKLLLKIVRFQQLPWSPPEVEPVS